MLQAGFRACDFSTEASYSNHSLVLIQSDSEVAYAGSCSECSSIDLISGAILHD